MAHRRSICLLFLRHQCFLIWHTYSHAAFLGYHLSATIFRPTGQIAYSRHYSSVDRSVNICISETACGFLSNLQGFLGSLAFRPDGPIAMARRRSVRLSSTFPTSPSVFVRIF